MQLERQPRGFRERPHAESQAEPATNLLYLAIMPAKPRARDLGIPFQGEPGPLNAITDVAGVEVGHCTLIKGEHVRTGVSTILPLGRAKATEAVPAAFFSLNGNGELTGSHWLEEVGMLEGPVLLTNTHSVGTARDACIRWLKAQSDAQFKWFLPVVGETFDGVLNDIDGFHVGPEHVREALEGAQSGPVPEGGVGGGTGMIAHGFKGGVGSASRKLASGHVLGVLVQANYGTREELTIRGVPVGLELADELRPVINAKPPEREGSIIIIIATDAPLLPQAVKRLARRASLGLARLGSVARDSSGDLFLAFSTETPRVEDGYELWRTLPHHHMNDLFAATVQATEEAILNALVVAEPMTGLNGNRVEALPHLRVQEILRKYGRLV